MRKLKSKKEVLNVLAFAQQILWDEKRKHPHPALEKCEIAIDVCDETAAIIVEGRGEDWDEEMGYVYGRTSDGYLLVVRRPKDALNGWYWVPIEQLEEKNSEEEW